MPKPVDPEVIALEVNECLLAVLGNCDKAILERRLRRIMSIIGYVPTNGLPLERENVESYGVPSKYTVI